MKERIVIMHNRPEVPADDVLDVEVDDIDRDCYLDTMGA